MNLSRVSRLRTGHLAVATSTSCIAIAYFAGCGGGTTSPGGSTGTASGTTSGVSGSTTGSTGGTTGTSGGTTGTASGSTAGATGSATGSTGAATGSGTTGTTTGATGTTTGAAGTATGATGTATGATGTTGTTAGTSGTASGGDGGCAPIGAKLAHPNPIISRGAAAYLSVLNATPTFYPAVPAGAATSDPVVDGQYHNGGWGAGMPTVAAPSWAAIKLAAGPTRVLVSWDDGGTYNYQDVAGTTVYGFPANYMILTSADSTNGANGTWTTQVTVTGNAVRTRAHSIPFAGQTWVKLMITAAPPTISSNGVQIGEIDVHDISATGTCLPEDTWFFMGDSITAFAFDRATDHQPSFAAGINAASSAYFPAMINGGIGGELSANGLARLQADLNLNPDYRFFALSYGTNDAGNNVGTTTFQSNMQSMITMLKTAGRIPVIPHIPYSGDGGHNSIPAYNTVIDALVASNGLMAGPDLYAFFMANSPADFECGTGDASTGAGCSGNRATDLLHPNDVGLKAMNALWTTAMRPLYP